MTIIEWLELAKERIQMAMHNKECRKNIYLEDSIKFINEAIELKNENED